METARNDFVISTDRSRLDFNAIHAYLTQSYWAKGVDIDTVKGSIEHSLPFGVYHGETLCGFGRVITDYTTFAYIADVFVLPEYQKRGLGKWLIETMLDHPQLQGLRTWALKTVDAQELYRKLGFEIPALPRTYMQRSGK